MLSWGPQPLMPEVRSGIADAVQASAPSLTALSWVRNNPDLQQMENFTRYAVCACYLSVSSLQAIPLNADSSFYSA